MKRILKSVVAVTMVLSLAACSSDKLKLKSEEYNLEYGQAFDTDVSTYLDGSEDTLKKVTMETGEGIITDSTDGSYTPVGEYTVTFTLDKQTEEMKVIVADTTAPEFTKSEETVKLSSKDDESTLSEKFEASDLSNPKVTFDTSSVDYTKQGDYKCTATATDDYDNKTDLEFTVTVPKQEIKLNKNKVSLTVGKTFTLKNTNKNFTESLTYTSSDESVATVSKKGKITAVKAGSATITVKGGDSSKKCKVTVSEKVVAANNNNSGTSNSSSSNSSSASSNTSGKWAMTKDELKSYIASTIARKATAAGLTYKIIECSKIDGEHGEWGRFTKNMTAAQMKAVVDQSIDEVVAETVSDPGYPQTVEDCIHITTVNENEWLWRGA